VVTLTTRFFLVFVSPHSGEIPADRAYASINWHPMAGIDLAGRAFRGRKFTLGITCVQITVEKAQPIPYDGDSNTRHQPTDFRR